ncbi:MAG: hypothetical protein ACKOE6_05500, partial [Flammeovirgaceae bacterium]
VGDVAVIQADHTKGVGLLIADDKVLHVNGRVRVDQRVEHAIQDIDSKINTSTIECFLRVLTE